MMKINDLGIIYFGMLGEYSRIPLESLMEAGANIKAVIVPHNGGGEADPIEINSNQKNENDLVVLNNYLNDSIVSEALNHRISVYSIANLNNPKFLHLIEKAGAALSITVCFPKIFPSELLNLFSKGSVNLHPSLLPAYRGPHPMFWQFRNAEKQTGVTLHFMDKEVDHGDIISQAQINYPQGVRAQEADQIAAQRGAELLIEALKSDPIPRTVQPTENASYHARPSKKDKVIPLTWDVLAAFNFIRGADEWAPFWVNLSNGKEIEIREAINFKMGEKIGSEYIRNNGSAMFQFKDGVLEAR